MILRQIEEACLHFCHEICEIIGMKIRLSQFLQSRAAAAFSICSGKARNQSGISFACYSSSACTSSSLSKSKSGGSGSPLGSLVSYLRSSSKKGCTKASIGLRRASGSYFRSFSIRPTASLGVRERKTFGHGC